MNNFMEKSRSIKFLEAHQAKEKSKFVENACKRQDEQVWLNWSQSIALSIMDYMLENNISRSDLANMLGMSHQYVSEILSGKANFSLKSIASISHKLHLDGLINNDALQSVPLIAFTDEERRWLQDRINVLSGICPTRCVCDELLVAREAPAQYNNHNEQEQYLELSVLQKLTLLLM